MMYQRTNIGIDIVSGNSIQSGIVYQATNKQINNVSDNNIQNGTDPTMIDNVLGNKYVELLQNV